MNRYIEFGAGKGDGCCLLIMIVSFLSDLEFIAFHSDNQANRWQAVWTRFCSLRLSRIHFMFSLFHISIHIHGAFACGRCQLMHNTNNNEKVKKKYEKLLLRTIFVWRINIYIYFQCNHFFLIH